MLKRILVLGATGFIGSRVVQYLSATDWASTIAASRRTVMDRQPAATSRTTMRVDAATPEDVAKALQDVDLVVNCIAGSPDNMVNSARTLFKTAASMPTPPPIVHLSSMAVYGSSVGEVDESNLSNQELSPYGLAKLETERLASSYPSIVIFRPGIVYGPGSAQWSGRIARWLRTHRIGDLGPDGDGYCNLIYIDDLVLAVAKALLTPSATGRAFNLSLPQPPTWNEYFESYAKALGAVPLKRITRRRLKVETKILAPPLKILEILTKKLARRAAHIVPDALPSSLVRLFSQEIRMNVNCAERILGLSWTPLDRGLTQTAEWYRRSR